MFDSIPRSLTPAELSRRWRCRTSTIRRLIRTGAIPAIQIVGRTRITPEAIHEAEKGPLAVKPTAKKRQRDRIPAEVAELLAD